MKTQMIKGLESLLKVGFPDLLVFGLDFGHVLNPEVFEFESHFHDVFGTSGKT